MVKTLVRKQLQEIFRGFFFDRRKNRARSLGGIILSIVGFAVVMLGVLGGMFTALSLSLSAPLAGFDLGWMYFAILSLLGVLLGVFGSVFNTYSSLYLAKDNDLLLSMPISTHAIITSRLLSVYFMGLMYSAVVMLPAAIVWWITVGPTAANVVGGLLLTFLISVFVLLLSCLLGWVVAKISVRLKNKSFVVVLLSLAFIALYYFFYFKAQELIQDLISNALVYGEAVQSRAPVLYYLGRVGEGDWLAMLYVTVAIAALAVLTWAVLSRTFLGIATAAPASAKRVYREKPVRVQSLSRALLGKELRRFTSNANYMLNCGLSTLFLLVAGVALLWKGRFFFELLTAEFALSPLALALLTCSAVCMLASMNDMATPAVSLEGKTLWLLQSLPVSPWLALRAKLSLQLWLTSLPMLFCSVCAGVVLHADALSWLVLLIIPQLYELLLAGLGLMLGTVRADLHWTNEAAPIKQSMAVMLVLLLGWVLALIPGGGYLLLGGKLGSGLWTALNVALFALGAALVLLWLKSRGAARFAALH